VGGSAAPEHRHLTQRDVVVVGASAGGVDTLQQLVAGLPGEFPATVLVVLHVPSTGRSVLPDILSRKGPLPAAFARDGEEARRGQIYVAPADHHMLLHEDRISLTQGPRENGHRPAVDPLFRSAARAVGPRCIGVILSGLLDDGAAGLRLVKQLGGAALVQDPAQAMFPSMPQAALAMTPVDVVAPADKIAAELCRLIDTSLLYPPPRVAENPGNPHPTDRTTANGDDRVEAEDPRDTAELLEGPPTGLTCPECGGALWAQDDGDVTRFACHVGHAYSLSSLLEEQGRGLEMTLWSAVRALEERADIHRRVARRVGGKRDRVYEQRASEAEEHARALRAILTSSGRMAAASPEEA
jgi:two-component system chemotaxis response regulator CheB